MPQPAPAELTLAQVAKPGRKARAVRHLPRFAGLALLGLLAACASHNPRLSATQQAAQYKDNASGDYAPPGPASDPWGPYINEAAQRFDVPPSWIRNVMHTESGGHLYVNGQLVTSGVGAMGLMQVMPETYQELSAEYNLGDDPYAPHDNIMAGAAYLREMYDLFGSPGFLAAYNAGPQRLNQYLTDGRPLPAETTHYVAMIAPYIHGDMPSGRSPADRFAMNSMNAPSGRAYNGGGYAPPSLANTGGGAVSGNMMMALNQAPSPQVAAVATESSADDLNAQQVAQHGAALAASGGGAVPADLMVAMNDPRPTAAQVAQQEVAADNDGTTGPGDEQAAVVAQAPLQAPPPPAARVVPMPAIVQPRVVQAPMRMAVNVPPPPLAPIYIAAPSYHPPVVQPRVAAYEPPPVRLPAPPPPAPARAVQLAAYTPPLRRTVVGSRGEHNLAMEINEPAVVPTHRTSGFRLISPAMADTLPMASTGHGGGWAIQVGAYRTAGDAREAVGTARQHSRYQLASASTVVMPVRVSSKTLFRARLGGLSENAAVNACSTLSHGRTPCMVLSPDAQN
jgi:Transglycosylase SLT domain/SPOR domain